MCACMCACMRACVLMCMRACVQVSMRPCMSSLGISVRCFPQSLTLFLRQCLPESGSRWLSEADWPANPRKAPVSTSPVWVLQACTTVPSLVDGCSGSRLKSSCLHSQHASDWTAFLVRPNSPRMPGKTFNVRGLTWGSMDNAKWDL